SALRPFPIGKEKPAARQRWDRAELRGLFPLPDDEAENVRRAPPRNSRTGAGRYEDEAPRVRGPRKALATIPPPNGPGRAENSEPKRNRTARESALLSDI